MLHGYPGNGLADEVICQQGGFLPVPGTFP